MIRSRAGKTKIIVILGCALFACARLSAQSIYTWTNSAGGDLATAANWNPNGTPNPTAGGLGDTMLFDGQSAGPVVATSNAGGQVGAAGGVPEGLKVTLTANQVSPVRIITTVANNASFGIRFSDITNNSLATSFTLGSGSTTNALDTLWGATNPESHNLINNSTAPNYINLDVRWRLGAGGAHTFYFGGTGDWYITNGFASYGGGANLFAKRDSGTVYWTAGYNLYSNPGNVIASPMSILGGTVVLRSPNLFPAATTIIFSNSSTLIYDGNGAQTASSPITGAGSLHVNSGTLTLSGANTFSGGVTLSGGTIIVGTGSTNGSLGTGPISLSTTLVFGSASTLAMTNPISGAGGITQQGTGTLLLNGLDTYTGPTMVSSGAFGGSSTLASAVTVNPGATLVSGASASQIGTLTINSNLTIGGNVLMKINKSLAPSNDLVVVTGVLTNSGTGKLTITNYGPALMVGDRFVLFSQPLQNGAALTVAGSGVNWINNLASDGSVSVGSLIPPVLSYGKTGGNIQFSWTGGFKLQSQTNNTATGIGTNWMDYPGGATSPVTVSISSGNGGVFFRLVSTP